MAVQRKMFTLMTLAAMFIEVTMAVNYTVGAPGGSWDQQTDLKAWASIITFHVGDNLIFSYGPTHDVVEVSQTNYASCVSSSPITFDNSGFTTISLDSATKRYFICGTAGHCQTGMKVEIDTQATSTPPPATPETPPPATPATPPPASPATPPPASPTTPPPTSPPVSPISPISPSTPSAKPPTSKSTVPPSGSGPAPPPKHSSAPKSGLHITLAMGVVGFVMVFLSL